MFCIPSFAETRTPVLIGNSITVHSGDLLQKETDLRIPGRAPAPSGAGRGMDYEFTRVYRSRITYEGPLGANWDHNYNKRLIERPDGNVARFDGEARFDIYEKLADGSYKSPSGYFDRLVKNADGTFTIRNKHGTVYSYATDGWVVEIKDRNGNTMAFGYETLTSPLLCKEGQGEVDTCRRLITVTDTAGRAITYFYNADKLIAITDFSGRVIARSGSDEAIYYYHTDALGSTTALTDSEGNIAETYQYGPYGDPEIHDASGALLEDSAAGNPFLYTGQMYDPETGFYYYKARYYHPTLGRFLQRDPLGYVDGYNLYSYVSNNPLNFIDPLGFYQEDVHRGLTEYLARKAGFSKQEAMLLGGYVQSPDNGTGGKLRERRGFV